MNPRRSGTARSAPRPCLPPAAARLPSGGPDLWRWARGLDGAAVAAALGLTPAPRERRKWGCPRCGSRDNLHVYPAGRGCYCFGCGLTGLVDLVAAALGCDPLTALGWLAACFGGPAELAAAERMAGRHRWRPGPAGRSGKRPTRRPPGGPAPEGRRDGLEAAELRELAEALAEAAPAVAGCPDGWEWLRGRGLAAAERRDLWPIRSWCELLARAARGRPRVAELAERAGLAPGAGRQGRAWLLALYRDPDGRPWAVRPRDVRDDDGRPWYGGRWAWPRGARPAEGWPWRAEALRRLPPGGLVLLVEGETDCLAAELALAEAAGCPVAELAEAADYELPPVRDPIGEALAEARACALALPGATTPWRQRWTELVAEARPALVVAFGDPDGAGRRMAEALAEALRGRVPVVATLTPAGLDLAAWRALSPPGEGPAALLRRLLAVAASKRR